MADDIQRITSPDDPERCQGMAKHGQCQNKSVTGTQFCKYHGGENIVKAEAEIRKSNYRLALWQSRIDEKANSSEVKSLRDEIGILRMILEEKLAQCQSATDLIIHSGPISDLILKIERTVKSCHHLESSMGHLLNKTDLIQFASEVVRIIDECVGDGAKTLLIANKISNLLDRDRENQDDNT